MSLIGLAVILVLSASERCKSPSSPFVCVFTHLFEDDGLSVELLCGVCRLLDLRRDGEAQSGELPHLSE